MSDGRRLRMRDQGSTKGGSPRGLHKKVRSRLGSMCVSNEDSTDGDEDSVVTSCGGAKKSVGRKSGVGVGVPPTTKDNDKGLRSYRRKSSKVSTTSLAEKDVIDGFLILSFATYQDLESEVKANEDSFTVSESEILMEPQQSDVDSKDDDDIRQPADKLETVLANGKQIINGHDKFIDETNKPNIPLEILAPVPEAASDVIASSKEVPIITSQLAVAVVKVKPEMHQNIICDTAEEEKKESDVKVLT